jgi:hypothetical protein
MKPENDLNNKYRALLTEVLPYELPILLNNEAFYRNMQDEELRKVFLEVFSDQIAQGDWTIPFDYEIRRAGGEKSRKLSLMHPLTQLDCVEHYAQYDEYMLNLCSHSPFSIRYIDKKAKCVFPPEETAESAKEDEMERPVELEDNEIEPRYRSYFSYKKYDLAYKFFESGDNLRLEQKYPYMMTLDVTACFYHIYTHSIAWAVKGRTVAKEIKKKDTFENAFDRLMRHSNYDETNGIIVGPEISRIFAEIILQAVDLAVLRQLKNKNFTLGRDYEIRRYVDDSYIYATAREKLETIRDVYQEQLALYKLDINKSKLAFLERPFTSTLSDAKHLVNEIITEFRNKYLKKGDEGQYTKIVRKDMSVFTGFVKQFRSITHRFQLNYGMLNKYTLSLLARQIRKEIKEGCIPSQGLLTAYAEIAFYIFSLDMHTTASYRLCSILDCLMAWADKNPDYMVKQELMNRIRREAKRVLDIYQATQMSTDTNLEALNLLISLNRLIGFRATVGQLEILFDINVDSGKGVDKLNYYQICTLLYLIENDTDYLLLKSKIEAAILTRFTDKKKMRESETAHLFFDMMTCPYLSKATSRTIIQELFGMKKLNKIDNRRAAIAKPKRWFFDWDKNHPLTSFLTKKEYHSPYE